MILGIIMVLTQSMGTKKMPIEHCRRDGKPGYRWGKTGKCYIYTPGDKASRKRALKRAQAQEQAIKAAGYKEK